MKKRTKIWDELADNYQVVCSRFGAVEQTHIHLRGQNADWLMDDKYQFWQIFQKGRLEVNKYLKQQLRKKSIWCNKPEPLNFFFRDGASNWQYVRGVSIFKIGTMRGKLELYKKLKHDETNVKVEEGMFEYNGKNKGEVIKSRPNITAVVVAASLSGYQKK